MKKFTIITLCSLFAIFTMAQQVRKVRRIVPIMSQQAFYLNGGIRSSFGGKSRTYYEINLPPNTVEWYYVFTTTDQGTASENLNLIPQLTKIFDPTGASAILASAIFSPTGSRSCDIFLTDRSGIDAFMQKLDNNGTSIPGYLSGIRQNFRNGVVQIKDITSGTVYLGFKNPSESVGIGISFEVAAVVEETVVDNDVWASNTKEKFYQKIYEQLKGNVADDIAMDLANCLVAKISAQKTPAQYDQMTDGERNNLYMNTYAGCADKYNLAKTPGQEKAVSYCNLGWEAYKNGDIDKCIEYSKKALIYDSSLGVVKANLGLCYLVKGDEAASTDYYIDAIVNIKAVKIRSTVQQYLKGAIDDINNALSRNPTLKGAANIRGMLQDELKNY